MEPSRRYVLEPAAAEKGDHQDRMINGELVQEFLMPSIRCSCAQRGGGFPATSVPMTVPLSWRKRPELEPDADLMSVLEFREWRARFVKALLEEGSTLENLSEEALQPGMLLHPMQFKAQSKRAICHPYSGWVVRRDVSQAIEKAGLTGIRFAPAVMPKRVESDYDVPHVAGASDVPEGVKRTICEICGALIVNTANREWRIRADRVLDVDFQILETTSLVLVSERVRALLSAHRDLNTVFREIEVI